MASSQLDPISESVSVHELVEWCFRFGDLGGERRFSGPQRAVQGVKGHQEIQKSRPLEYMAEVPLRWIVSTQSPDDHFTWELKGRADGIWPQKDNNYLIEEIKTITGAWNGEPKLIHWAQAKIYGAIYTQLNQLESIDIQLTYLDIDSGFISVFRDTFSQEDLSSVLKEAEQKYQNVLIHKRKWKAALLQSKSQLTFPFKEKRKGQQKFIERIQSNLTNGGMSMMEAPTGLGKTMAAIYPAVEYLINNPDSVIFFLTAKNTNKQNAEKALDILASIGMSMKRVTIGAHADWCLGEDKGCDILTCPYAVGYFDRIRESILECADQTDGWNRQYLQEFGRNAQLCPSALSHQLADWAQFIIADYNHALDPKSQLKSYFGEDNSKKIIFIIDEAHNLPDRARAIYSSSIKLKDLQSAHQAVPQSLAQIHNPLSRLIEMWTKLKKAGFESVLTELPSGWDEEMNSFKDGSERWLMQNMMTPFRDSVLESYFQTSDFLQRLLNLNDSDKIILNDHKLEILCLDPSNHFQKSISSIHSVGMFSATLSPERYYQLWLTNKVKSPFAQFESPYPSENIKVWIETGIKTQWQYREKSATTLVALLSKFVSRHDGNQMIFFPSYAYLELIYSNWQKSADQNSDLQFVVQKRESDHKTHSAFIQSISTCEGKKTIGLAVLGGIYAEGLDVPGNTIKAITVVGIGLPQICLERNLIKEYLQEKLDMSEKDAFDYAYAFPGLTKVIQAVGRLIRSETDSGSVLLVDPRYQESRYQEILPGWWNPHYFTFKKG